MMNMSEIGNYELEAMIETDTAHKYGFTLNEAIGELDYRLDNYILI